MKKFKDFNANFVVVHGTEESAYECWAECFTNADEATTFADEFETDCGDSGYCSYAKVCSNQKEFAGAVKEMIALRKEWFEEDGIEYDKEMLNPYFD